MNVERRYCTGVPSCVIVSVVRFALPAAAASCSGVRPGRYRSTRYLVMLLLLRSVLGRPDARCGLLVDTRFATPDGDETVMLDPVKRRGRAIVTLSGPTRRRGWWRAPGRPYRERGRRG